MIDCKNESYSPGEQDQDQDRGGNQDDDPSQARSFREPCAAGTNQDGKLDAPGPIRRSRSRHHDPSPRVSPYTVVSRLESSRLESGRFQLESSRLARRRYGNSGTMLYISNLAYCVSEEDIWTLFSEVGPLQNFALHYDRIGKSMGTGDVVFHHQSDAREAMMRYHNVALYEKLMKIEVGMSVPPPPAAAGEQEQDCGTKLYISNLAYGVSDYDIRTLFSDVGHLKNSTIHYDRNGRSMGTAEVVFFHQSDARAAIKRYHNVAFYEREMKIIEIGVSEPQSIEPKLSG